MGDAKALTTYPVHLGRAGRAVAAPEFTGDMAWYGAYEARHGDDGADGRLVSQFTFTRDWDSWEMHPHGEEVVICTAGSLVLHQEFPDGHTAMVTLSAGDYAINPAGVWHTADVGETATAVFITAGLGTEHRPRT